MKRYVMTLLILSALSFQMFSQNEKENYNSKLLAKYSKKELKNISELYPDSILFLNYIAEKGYYFIDFPKEKPISHEILENITEADLEQFNIFNYDIRFLENKNNYYKLGNTGKLMVVVSLREVKQFSKQEKLRK